MTEIAEKHFEQGKKDGREGTFNPPVISSSENIIEAYMNGHFDGLLECPHFLTIRFGGTIDVNTSSSPEVRSKRQEAEAKD
tara:strand:+ start:6380 stop:6622 length:243 start_codon:yes stop_codon:yes gene_type:complete